MANGLGELELEMELEGLGELEGEFESELEGEFETEFENEFENEFETEFENELESELEMEGEGEFELEGEFESMAGPTSRVYPDAMMEHLGLAAMEAETEFEAAEHFLPLIPLAASKLLPLAAKALPRVAAKVIPRVAHAITRATPRLTRSVGHLTRTLHRNPATRHLVRVMPSVARRAVASIAKHVAAGRPVTPHHAARILRREHHRVLRHPHIVRSVLRHSHAMDRRLHRVGGLPHHALHHPGHLHHLRHRHLLGGVPGRHHLAGVPRHLRHLHPHAAGWGARPMGVGHRARVCPTCGGSTRHGVRRVCCCC